MSVKLVVVYSTPEDKAAFNKHYDEVHIPLAKAVPGLSELRVSRMANRLSGDADVYQIAELVFPDQASFEAAMASDENRAAGADLANFAAGKVAAFIATD